MAAPVAEEVRSLAELQQNAQGIIEHVRRTRQPLRIAAGDGDAGVVVIDAETYADKLSALELRPLLAEAEEDVRAGRTRNMREFLGEFRRDQGIPG